MLSVGELEIRGTGLISVTMPLTCPTAVPEEFKKDRAEGGEETNSCLR